MEQAVGFVVLGKALAGGVPAEPAAEQVGDVAQVAPGGYPVADLDGQQVLGLAAAVEARSEHPIARVRAWCPLPTLMIASGCSSSGSSFLPRLHSPRGVSWGWWSRCYTWR